MLRTFLSASLCTLVALCPFTQTLSAQDTREVGNVVFEGVPEIPDSLHRQVQRYFDTRSASFRGWLPGGRGVLISTRFENTNQLHTVAEPNAGREQITFYTDPVREASVCPSPDTSGLLFLKDTLGNEFSQLYWFDLATERAELVSDGESRNYGVAWSNAGNQFAYTSSRRNGTDFDVYVSDISAPKRANLKISRGGGYWQVADWAPGDEQLLVTQYLSSTKSNSYLLDFNNNQLTKLNPDTAETTYLAQSFDATGKKYYFVSDTDREFNTLFEHDLKTGTNVAITADIPWDVEEFVLDEARARGAFTVNENGFSSVYLFSPTDGSSNKVEGIPVGEVSGLSFDPQGDRIAMTLSTSRSPGDVYTLDVGSKQLTRWTTSEVGGLDPATFPEPELITYPTFDEVDGAPRQIPAFVYKPVGKTDRPLPVLVVIHGGPESQFKPGFSELFTYLTNELGVAVIAPNVRGSSGYGKEYLLLDNDYKREQSVRDIGALVDWIESKPTEYDGSRIGAYGGSYGGYMVLSSLYNFNDKFKCGVEAVGISNFVTFLENTESYRQDARRAEYGDERKPEMREFLEGISPNRHTDQFKAPLFIVQGANDPRVPATESEQMVAAIREQGEQEVWYMLAKDEGHGFRKQENRDLFNEAMILFLRQHLLN